MRIENITGRRLAWSLAEVATALPLSPGFLRKQVKVGALKSRKIGRRLLILDEDLRAWLGQDRTAEGTGTESGK